MQEQACCEFGSVYRQHPAVCRAVIVNVFFHSGFRAVCGLDWNLTYLHFWAVFLHYHQLSMIEFLYFSCLQPYIIVLTWCPIAACANRHPVSKLKSNDTDLPCNFIRRCFFHLKQFRCQCLSIHPHVWLWSGILFLYWRIYMGWDELHPAANSECATWEIAPTKKVSTQNSGCCSNTNHSNPAANCPLGWFISTCVLTKQQILGSDALSGSQRARLCFQEWNHVACRPNSNVCIIHYLTDKHGEQW